MDKQNKTPELLQLLALEQQKIRENFRYVYYITRCLPDSNVSWPSDLREYDCAALHAQLCGSDRPSPNPYAQYDAWINSHCGPDGHARAGCLVGFRERGAAQAFLRWIFPLSTKHDMTLHLARMMMKSVPNSQLADKILLEIGEEITSVLSAGKLARLADRFCEMRDQDEMDEYSYIEAEQLSLKIMGGDRK